MLHRAFSKPAIPAPLLHDPARALEFALRLDLAARIGAFTPLGTLKAELGPAADELTKIFRYAVASGLRHEATLQVVASLAKSREIPLVILKGSALSFLGISAPGARRFSDLDILVPVDRILELRSVVVDAGWTLSRRSGSEHQEAPLTHPKLGMIELHRFVPGVRPPGSRRSHDARTLFEAGLTSEVGRFGGAVHAPARPILAAHALAHGLVQHGYAPGSYPLLRFVADLQDLRADPDLLRDAGLLLRDFDSADLDAIASLLAALESGAAFDLPDGPPRSLLNHLLAGVFDAGYALRLKAHLRSFRSPSNMPPAVAALKSIYRSIVLSRVQVDIIYGPPKRWGGYAARQLLRPFDVALRLRRSLRGRDQIRPQTRRP